MEHPDYRYQEELEMAQDYFKKHGHYPLYPTTPKDFLALECGLQLWGKDDDGEMEYFGRREAWELFDKQCTEKGL